MCLASAPNATFLRAKPVGLCCRLGPRAVALFVALVAAPSSRLRCRAEAQVISEVNLELAAPAFYVLVGLAFDVIEIARCEMYTVVNI